MRTADTKTHTTGTLALSILAGWTAPQTGLTADDRWSMVAAALRAAGCTDPRPAPMSRHHAIEAEAAELVDVMERDSAARVTFARRI